MLIFILWLLFLSLFKSILPTAAGTMLEFEKVIFFEQDENVVNTKAERIKLKDTERMNFVFIFFIFLNLKENYLLKLKFRYYSEGLSEKSGRANSMPAPCLKTNSPPKKAVRVTEPTNKANNMKLAHFDQFFW